jgi:DNA repair protein RadD
LIFQERQYQTEAAAAVHEHICTKQTNPCVVLPTGSGKSVVMASLIQRWMMDAPHVRGGVLAHRKELVDQNHGKLLAAYPEGDIGIFSAGLGRRDYDSSITFASIDSIFKRAGEFQPFDFLFVDEAHRIPPSGEGKYRTFINECKKYNPQLRVVGWTATSFRMNCGPICHKDHILNEICYEAKITDLIDQGFLSKLRSKVGLCQPDLNGVRRNSGGDYIVKSLAAATNHRDIVSTAVAEACRIMAAEGRKSAIFFCVSIDHCKRVSEELKKHGVHAPCITGKTRQDVRDNLIRSFKTQKLKAICCVNVLTEGFDAPHIDCIILLRPTLSPGLFSQMVGRGLRPFRDKTDCLVLDFAGCIDEHGPLDLLGSGDTTVMATCSECRESFSRAIRSCPVCGWEIPKIEVERLEAEEAERRMHSDKASKKSILSYEPEVYQVHDVFVTRHVKPGGTDSLKVSYRHGSDCMFREWICLDHSGFAGRKAAMWWRNRQLPMIGAKKELPTVNEALENMLLTQEILDWTKTITVKRNGKFKEIIGYNAPLEAAE